MMNEENVNEHQRLLQSDNEANQAQRGSAGRSEGQRGENEELLSVDDAGAIGNIEQCRTPAFAYASKEQVAQAMRDEPTHKYEIMYSHLLYNFEKEQIRRGLRNKINKTFERPRQITVNKASHKNFVTDNDLRKI